MRALLLTLALVGLPVAWMVAVWLFVRDRAAATFPFLTIGERLNIALLVLAVMSAAIALVGVAIAVTSYRRATDITRWQLEAGNRQSETLQAQTQALAAAREALETMSKLSEKTRESLAAEIDLARQREAELAAKRARLPRIEVDFGSTSWTTLRQVLEQKRKLAVRRDQLWAGQATFTIRNVGGTPLVRPVVVVSASDPSIDVNPREFSGDRAPDVLPYSTSGKAYTYQTRIKVPPTVGSFELTFQIFGANMTMRQLVLPIVLVES